MPGREKDCRLARCRDNGLSRGAVDGRTVLTRNKMGRRRGENGENEDAFEMKNGGPEVRRELRRNKTIGQLRRGGGQVARGGGG